MTSAIQRHLPLLPLGFAGFVTFFFVLLPFFVISDESIGIAVVSQQFHIDIVSHGLVMPLLQPTYLHGILTFGVMFSCHRLRRLLWFAFLCLTCCRRDIYHRCQS